MYMLVKKISGMLINCLLVRQITRVVEQIDGPVYPVVRSYFVQLALIVQQPPKRLPAPRGVYLTRKLTPLKHFKEHSNNS